MPRNLKRFRHEFYDAKAPGAFAVYYVPEDANKIERAASIAGLISQACWAERNLWSPYSEGIYLKDGERIIGLSPSALELNKNIKPIFDHVMEYIKRGWLPADQSKWDELMYRLMDEDADNVFSEPSN